MCICIYFSTLDRHRLTTDDVATIAVIVESDIAVDRHLHVTTDHVTGHHHLHVGGHVTETEGER